MARSAGKPRVGTPIDRARHKKAVGMLCFEMFNDRTEPRRFQVTGNPVLSPSIDGGIGGGRTDVYGFTEGNLL